MNFNGVNGTGSEPPKMNPDLYAQQYASEKNISLEEAKAQLKSKYGDPESASIFTKGFQFSGTGAEVKINPFGALTDDPEKLAAFVKNGAKETGVTEKEFAEMVGLPPKGERGPENTELEKLRKLGIPQEVIEKGDDAIRKYAKEHNINLPPKKERGHEDAKLEELRKLGIPQEVIEEGDDAIRKYAKEHNINLPPKEKR